MDFELVDPKTGRVRRNSDAEELRVVFEHEAHKAGDNKELAAQKAIRRIAAIKAATPNVCEVSGLTGVRYC